MNSESPQRLYARSLFEIAEESGSQERTLRELMCWKWMAVGL